MEWIEPGEPTPDGGRAPRSRAGGAAPVRRRRLRRPWPGYIGPLAAGQHPDDRARGARGSPSAACFRISGSRPIAAHSPRPTSRWSTQIIETIEPVRHRASRPAARTATCGRGTCCGPPTVGPGWSIRRRRVATGRPIWPSWRCSAACPIWTRCSRAYREAYPLADGWRDRVPLHQLHLLLVHTAAFGVAYRDAVRDRRGRLPARLSRPSEGSRRQSGWANVIHRRRNSRADGSTARQRLDSMRGRETRISRGGGGAARDSCSPTDSAGSRPICGSR